MSTTHSEHPNTLSLLRLLGDNHQQSEVALQYLERLVHNIANTSSDTKALHESLRTVAYFFKHRIHENHVDEEVYMYQFLLNSSDKKWTAIAHNLLEEHTWIEETWALLQNMLKAALDTLNTQHIQELSYAAEVFVRLKRAHMQQETEIVFPAAKQFINKDVVQRIAQVLTQRHEKYTATDDMLVA